jgi:hypothetical protein
MPLRFLLQLTTLDEMNLFACTQYFAFHLDRIVGWLWSLRSISYVRVC